MNKSKKSENFIRRVYKENNIIIVEDSDKKIIVEDYSSEKYIQLKQQMIDSLELFDIDNLKGEIFEGKLRRIILIIIGAFGLAICNFNIVLLLTIIGLVVINERILKESIQKKEDYDSSKYFLKYEELFNNKINDNNQVKDYVDQVNQKLNSPSINYWQIKDLRALRSKILEEAGLSKYSSKSKILKKTKK